MRAGIADAQDVRRRRRRPRSSIAPARRERRRPRNYACDTHNIIICYRNTVSLWYTRITSTGVKFFREFYIAKHPHYEAIVQIAAHRYHITHAHSLFIFAVDAWTNAENGIMVLLYIIIIIVFRESRCGRRTRVPFGRSNVSLGYRN